MQKVMLENRQLDKTEKSEIFKGFTRDELHEILIEYPEEKRILKERKNESKVDPKQPVFDNQKLI